MHRDRETEREKGSVRKSCECVLFCVVMGVLCVVCVCVVCVVCCVYSNSLCEL